MRRMLFVAVLVSVASVARAQLPTATGRTFTLTDTAWKLFIPSTYQGRGAVADVLVHFHGDSQVVWNNARYAGLNTIVLSAHYGGASSAYQNPFVANTSLFGNMLSEALTKVRAESDFADNLQWDKVAVSSFSAGYAAVREILKQPGYYNQISSLLLADTVYASFTSSSDHTPLDSQMADFRRFAMDAKNGLKTMFFTHSQVLTYTYCNTAETADDLMSYIGVAPSADNSTGLGGLQYYRWAHSGNFTMRGATGADGASHLLHLNYSGDWMAALPLAHVPEPGMAGGAILAMLALARRRGITPPCAIPSLRRVV